MNNSHDIPKAVLELLPWYAMGKLSEEDQTFFEKALSKYSLLKKQLEQESQLIELITSDKTLIDLGVNSSQEERLKSVMNMIDISESKEHTKIHNKASSISSLINKLKYTFHLLIPNQEGTSKYTRLASIGILVLSVGILTAVIAPVFTEKSDFIPASAKSKISIEQTTTSLLVGFNGTSIELTNNAALKDKLTNISPAPEGEGIYQIKFEKKLSLEVIKQTLDALQNQKELIWFAGEAF